MDDVYAFKARMVEMANANAGRFEGKGVDELKQLIDEADFVMAVWADLREPNGVDMMVIKGDRLLQNSIMTNMTTTVRTDAVLVRNIEEAVAMKQVFGEPAVKSH